MINNTDGTSRSSFSIGRERGRIHSGNVAPTVNVSTGDFWLDRGNATVRVNLAGTWRDVGSTVFYDMVIPDGALPNDLWYDTFAQELKIFDGNVWTSVGSQGEVGFTGSRGFTGSAGDNTIVGSHIHTQDTASTTWTVTHNLGTRYLTVEVIDSTGRSRAGKYDYPDITFVDANTLTATFTTATSGTLVANSGGGQTGPAGGTGFTGSQGPNGFTGSVGFTGSAGDNTIVGSHIHAQGVASNTWSVNHNLGTQYLTVEVIDDTGNSLAGAYNYPTISFDDSNNLTATFIEPVAGTLVANSGGGQQGPAGADSTVPGPVGFTGSQGTQGFTGSQGTQGVQGIVGFTGSRGTTGFTGSQGPIGYTGSRGTTGFTGSRGTTGFTGSQGEQGNFGGAAFEYAFSTDTTATDPGSATLKFNNATLSSATELYIDDEEVGPNDIQNYLRTIDDSTSTIKGHFKVSLKSDSSVFAMYAINSLTENTGFFTVVCSHLDGAPSFANGAQLVITFARTGDKGDVGFTGSTGFTGSQGFTGSSGLSADLQTVTDNGSVTTNGITVAGMVANGNVTLNREDDAVVFTTSGTPRPSIKATDTLSGTNRLQLDSDNGFFFTLDGNANNVGDFDIYDLNSSSYLFRVLNNGNVGIGTSSPDSKFVVSNGEASSGVELIPSTGSSSLVSIDRNTNGFEPFRYRALDHRFEAGASQSEAMRIDSGSNVGIGTSSPGARLDVSSNGGDFGIGARIRADTNWARLDLLGAGLLSSESSVFYQASLGDFVLLNTCDNRSITVEQQGAGVVRFATNASERMRIDPSGNVGIGTSSPAFKVEQGQIGGNAFAFGNGGFTLDGVTVPDYGVSYTSPTGEFNLVASGFSNIKFCVNRLERMRIDSSGNVGIGTGADVDVLGADFNTVNLRGKSTTSGGGLRLQTSDKAVDGGVYTTSSSGLTLGAFTVDPVTFITNSTERMRIDSSGNLLVGKSSASTTDSGIWALPQGRVNYTVSADGGTACGFYSPSGGSGAVGSIVVGAATTNYNTSSDVRLKENIVDAPSASRDIEAIQIRSFDWKSGGAHQKYGVIAQEIVNVAPEAVSQGETEDDIWGVDYSKLVPMMIKEIQELRARVAQLESKDTK